MQNGKTTKSHSDWLRIDDRVAGLDMIVKALSDTLNVLRNQIGETNWYDADWFLEESEPIYGLAFIAFQNYINGSVKDFAGSLTEKEMFYKVGQGSTNSTKSKIELIIGLANYSKHKDEGRPHKGTREVLDHFKLDYQNVTYLDKSPIFQGITLLNPNWNLFDIKDSITHWRESLWSRNE